MSEPVALPAARQLAFDELDTPLYDTTFVVVDLETTGTSPDGDAITEIGAVKVRGGEVLGEFATLVNPGFAIPPAIVQITGITTAMVYEAPRIEAVLPGFLEFAAGAVLVAHNARFDTAFLKAAAARQDIAWPNPQVLCTVKLARRVLTRDEAPSARLGVLAAVLGAGTTPTHRALDDARATVDVLHALIGRVGNQGVHSLTELLDYLPGVTGTQRAKRAFATDLPAAPGVYLFRGPSEEVLYIGTAVNLRRRVRNYFTGSETRGRMKEMVALAIRVDHVVCAHGLEAGVRELRLLAAHAPPYNRRSKFPRKGWWLTLSAEAFPRLVAVRTPTRTALGPFASRADAVDVAATVAEFAGLRTCSTRLTRAANHACPPAVVGGCPAARADGELDAAGYAPAVHAIRDLFTGRSDTLLRAMLDRIETHSTAQHFEAAARLRDRTAAVVTMLHRTQRLAALARIPELIVAVPDGEKGWEFSVIRYGRLAAAGTAPRGTPPMAVVDQIVAAAETVVPDLGDAASRKARTGRPGSTASAIAQPNAPSTTAAPAAGAQVAASEGAPGGACTAGRRAVVIPDRAGSTANARTGDDAMFSRPSPSEDDVPPLRGASPAEVGVVARWLAMPGARIVRTSEGYREPLHGAARWVGWAKLARTAATAISPEDEYLAQR
ncbi:DEDD exonuclease domain-containing protein [Nocardia mangyaensis]|uniref:DEDD exonuclease domain-containing protein n=1 Tax=Nocardia mangyaensis TaxID=2213200 RepID=UPI002676D185|nr:DEDD exonuclease domain-containing protein [Nocardia mangyaensis]MDO3649954.1 DEDD exonuclease domain-containing protein [Nocardia mangyaensis]